MSANQNHLELVKQVAQDLDVIIEKIGNLVFWPITWDDSYFLLRELETAVGQIDTLSEQLEPIYFDDGFWNDPQNKDFVENIEEASKCFDSFSMHFSRIYSALEEEGPRENYEEDGEFLSAQLKKAKQHLNKIFISNDISIKGNKNYCKKISKNFGVSEIVYTFVVDLDL